MPNPTVVVRHRAGPTRTAPKRLPSRAVPPCDCDVVDEVIPLPPAGRTRVVCHDQDTALRCRLPTVNEPLQFEPPVRKRFVCLLGVYCGQPGRPQTLGI
jgi:hypothetical protein